MVLPDVWHSRDSEASNNEQEVVTNMALIRGYKLYLKTDDDSVEYRSTWEGQVSGQRDKVTLIEAVTLEIEKGVTPIVTIFVPVPRGK